MDRRAFLAMLASLPAWAVDFATVRRGQPLRFPYDHGAHPDFRNEWWYVTGWLALPDGQPLGFQCTFFRVRTGLGEGNPSAFAPRQLLIAHAALADPRHGRLRHDERSARPGFGLAGFAEGRTAAWIGDWRFVQDEGRYHARVRADGFAYDLTLTSPEPPMVNGEGGFSAKAADARHASYYYSRPQLAVHGTVMRDGQTQAVRGRAWLDHEWSSELLPTGAQGWDWVGLNFDDGGALMAFRLRRDDGLPLWAAATLQQADGTTTSLPSAAVAFAPLRTWRSPRTGIAYPVEWRVQAGGRTLHLTPLIDDQELDGRRSTGAIYWEGAVRAVEEGREVGRGYLELTGYGAPLRLG